ncbi:1519_t:CDS:2, partial [Funneliformis geosporum]
MNINDFFNNISEVDENFTYIPDKIAIELARQLNTSKNNSSNEENIESGTVSLITKIANSNDINLKNKALSLIAPTLQILEKHETIDSITIPSFFTIQTIFKFYQINLNNEEADWSSEKCYNFDKQIANLLLKNRKQIESQKLHLEEPKSSLEFYEALPFQLIQFFENMIQTLLERLYNQTNERQQQ